MDEKPEKTLFKEFTILMIEYFLSY
jgi:hypothetical protein